MNPHPREVFNFGCISCICLTAVFWLAVIWGSCK